MRRFTFAAVLAITSLAVAAPVPPPNTREAAQLVEKLGNADFAEREAAAKRLDELGALALDDLRAACKSENPEVAERAKDLVRKIERRISNDRELAPTIVELDAKDTPLDAVLAALSKQAGCEVVLGGLKADDAAGKKITIATGKVPFWTAVVKVCEAGDLQIAGVSGFVAPGALPYHGRANQIRGVIDGATIRIAAEPGRAVVLEARDGAKKRPWSVQGAVLVEAFEPWKGGAPSKTTTALLQLWPEPKLAWQSVASLKVTKATDAGGLKLTPDGLSPAAWVPERMGRPSSGPAVGASSNVRQALVKFKPGEELPKVARELTGSVYGLVRASAEPLATVTLDSQKATSAHANVEMTAKFRTDDKAKKFVDVKLVYPAITVEPAPSHGKLPGVESAAGVWNRTVLGLRVTDAGGAAFDLALPSQRTDFDSTGRLIVVQMTLELTAAKDGPTVPAKVVFWASAIKPVEVPFSLKDVPLSGGTK